MYDTPEEIKLPDVVFNGTDGKECEAFIVAIHEFAFSKGCDDDHQWLLRFAKTRLRGEALRWWAKLDPSIKKDWDLFIQALFDEYPSIGAPDIDRNVTPVWSTTTFSPSPSMIILPADPELDPNFTEHFLKLGPVFPIDQPQHENSDGLHLSSQDTYPSYQQKPSGAKQLIGRLRIVNEDDTGIPQYVRWDYLVEEEIHEHTKNGKSYSHPKRTTLNRQEALIVSFLPSSSPHQIGCLNSGRNLRTLAISWSYSFDTESFTLYGRTNNYPFISQAAGKRGFISKVWSVLADGTLQASFSSFSIHNPGQYYEANITTTEIHVDTSGETIHFVKPGTILEQDKPRGNPLHPFVRARIVFEPL